MAHQAEFAGLPVGVKQGADGAEAAEVVAARPPVAEERKGEVVAVGEESDDVCIINALVAAEALKSKL